MSTPVWMQGAGLKIQTFFSLVSLSLVCLMDRAPDKFRRGELKS